MPGGHRQVQGLARSASADVAESGGVYEVFAGRLCLVDSGVKSTGIRLSNSGTSTRQGIAYQIQELASLLECGMAANRRPCNQRTPAAAKKLIAGKPCRFKETSNTPVKIRHLFN